MDEIPLKESLSKLMRISVLIKENGDLWLVYDTEIEEKLEWVEFDSETKTLILVTNKGNMHDIDLKLKPRAYERLLNAKIVFLMFMRNGETLEKIREIPVTVRDIY